MSVEVPPEWDDQSYMDRYPDVRLAVAQGRENDPTSGYDHFIRQGIVEGRVPAWRAKSTIDPARLPWPWSASRYLATNADAARQHWQNGTSAAAHYLAQATDGIPTGLETELAWFRANCGLPEWVMPELLEQARIEPGLDHNKTQHYPLYSPFGKTDIARSLAGLFPNLRQPRYDILFFLPWLNRGGADLAAILHIRAAVERGMRVAVALTENASSLWTGQLPEQVDVIDFGVALQGVSLDFHAVCCYHLIVALQVDKVHVLNSHAAWHLITDRAPAIAARAELYVSLFCYDYTPHGEPVGYARRIRQCANAITRIYSDNTAFATHLRNDLGVPAEKIVVLRHPVKRPASLLAPLPHSNRILWASRLDRQKRPELLAAIAARLPRLNFDVYGTGTMENVNPGSLFDAIPNISYRGAFDHFSSIASAEYRLFLYTSAWDGLPNIALEAMASGMLLVAPAIGGLVTDVGAENCCLVEDHDDPDAYAAIIRQVYGVQETAEATRLRGQLFVRTHHTHAGFMRTLVTSGYFARPDPGRTHQPADAVTAPSPPAPSPPAPSPNGKATNGTTQVAPAATGPSSAATPRIVAVQVDMPRTDTTAIDTAESDVSCGDTARIDTSTTHAYQRATRRDLEHVA